MIGRRISTQDIRTMLAMYAVFLATIICHGERHFTIVLSQLTTWYLATQHRCGLLLIATLIWLACESISRVCSARPSSRRLYRMN